jgi:Nuclease-related domain
MSEPSRSPIKDKPLRLPGQSLQEERAELISDKLESWLLSAVFMLVLAGWEWFRYFQPGMTSPWVMTVAAAGVCIYVAFRIYRLRPRLKALTQGIEGEKVVGQFLDRLREQGYSVFHDVMAEGFNIDHVLVGPGGVLTIETKTWSKPARGDARVAYDGARVLVAGRVPDRDPIAQAKSQAKWIGAILMESTGRRLFVQPVVVFPGWFVEAAPGSQQTVWVLEPKGLPAFLSRQVQQLSAEDVKLAAYHLSRFIRAGERERSAKR